MIIPQVLNKLEWDFVDKQGDQWVILNNNKRPVIQLSCYAGPLTAEQLKKLAILYKK